MRSRSEAKRAQSQKPAFLTPVQLQAELQTNRHYSYRLARKLGFKHGQHLLVPRERLDAWVSGKLEENRNAELEREIEARVIDRLAGALSIPRDTLLKFVEAGR